MTEQEKHFIEFQSEVFGYGYGTGDEHTLRAIKGFLAAINGCTYDYRLIENTVGPQIAWLLINMFCHADLIDYGTSPRFGWLSDSGLRLKEFVDARTVEEMGAILAQETQDFEGGEMKDNPFLNRNWKPKD